MTCSYLGLMKSQNQEEQVLEEESSKGERQEPRRRALGTTKEICSGVDFNQGSYYVMWHQVFLLSFLLFIYFVSRSSFGTLNC